MSDFYIGIDLIEVERIKSSIDTLGQRFINKIYSSKEQVYCSSKSNPYMHYAGRFAAKEAVMKALMSSGYNKPISFISIQIESLKSGEPNVIFQNPQKGICKVSISHTKSHAIASSIYVIE